VTALAPEALHLRDRDALNSDIRDGLSDVIQLERLDDRGYQLHCIPAPGSWARAPGLVMTSRDQS
jgi:hypothetical protein